MSYNEILRMMARIPAAPLLYSTDLGHCSLLDVRELVPHNGK